MGVVNVNGNLVTVPDGTATLNQNFPDIEDVQREYGDGLINTPAGQRGNFFSLDPGGIFGTRQAEIERLAKGEFTPGQGFDLGRNAASLGITQQDVANYYMTQYQRVRRNTESGKYGETYFPEGQKPNAATSQLQLDRKVGEIKAINQLTSEIRAIDGGGARLSQLTEKLGRNPTKAELETLKSVAQNNTRDAIQGRESNQAIIENTEAQTAEIPQASARADRNVAVNEGTLELNRVNAENTQAINLAQINLSDKMAQYEHDIAKITLANQTQQANADRDLRRDLAMLTREDNAADRAYNRQRDERESRQLMILQLMKGLQGLGQSIAI